MGKGGPERAIERVGPPLLLELELRVPVGQVAFAVCQAACPNIEFPLAAVCPAVEHFVPLEGGLMLARQRVGQVLEFLPMLAANHFQLTKLSIQIVARRSFQRGALACRRGLSAVGGWQQRQPLPDQGQLLFFQTRLTLVERLLTLIGLVPSLL